PENGTSAPSSEGFAGTSSYNGSVQIVGAHCRFRREKPVQCRPLRSFKRPKRTLGDKGYLCYSGVASIADKAKGRRSIRLLRLARSGVGDRGIPLKRSRNDSGL